MRPIASPASRQCGTPRSSRMRCSKPAATRRQRRRTAGSTGSSRCRSSTWRGAGWSSARRRSSARASGARARDRARGERGAVFDESISRAREWIVGLQCRDGGFGAFDADNAYHYLNNIPFADHGALLDPPPADLPGRCLSLRAQLGERAEPSEPMRRAIEWIRRDQLPEGSGYGRWGMNYIYGTWSVLCALNAAGVDRNDPMVRKAGDWLLG